MIGQDALHAKVEAGESRRTTDVPKERRAQVSQGPPAHLAGALQAAAAARAQAERIRRRHRPPAREQPPAETSTPIPPEPRAARPGPGRSSQPRFAKTIAAAQRMSPALQDQELVPWHLSPRDEIDPRSWPRRWLTRVFKGRAGGRESEAPGAHSPARPLGSAARAAPMDDRTTVAAVEPPPRRPVNALAPAGGDCGALVRRPGLGPAAADRKEPPAPDGVARVLSLLAREFRWHEVSGAAISRRRRAAVASAPDAVPGRAAAGATPTGMARLPVVASGGGMVAWPGGGLARVQAEIRPGRRRPAAAPRRRTASARSRAAIFLISCGVFAGFALGIVASGGAPVKGLDFGQIASRLDALLPRSTTAPAPARTPDDAGTARPAVDPERPGQDDRADGSQGAHPAPLASGSSAAADRRPAAAAPAADEPSWAAFYGRGHRAQSEGDLVAATHWYREAARLNPHHPAILYDLGYVLQIQGDIDAAIAQYRKVLTLNPNHAYAQYDLGFLLQKKGDKEGAMIQYKKAAKLNPDNPYIYFDWARILESNNDLAGARARYEKAAELAPQQRPGTDARRRLAALNARMDEP